MADEVRYPNELIGYVINFYDVYGNPIDLSPDAFISNGSGGDMTYIFSGRTSTFEFDEIEIAAYDDGSPVSIYAYSTPDDSWYDLYIDGTPAVDRFVVVYTDEQNTLLYDFFNLNNTIGIYAGEDWEPLNLDNLLDVATYQTITESTAEIVFGSNWFAPSGYLSAYDSSIHIHVLSSEVSELDNLFFSIGYRSELESDTFLYEEIEEINKVTAFDGVFASFNFSPNDNNFSSMTFQFVYENETDYLNTKGIFLNWIKYNALSINGGTWGESSDDTEEPDYEEIIPSDCIRIKPNYTVLCTELVEGQGTDSPSLNTNSSYELLVGGELIESDSCTGVAGDKVTKDLTIYELVEGTIEEYTYNYHTYIPQVITFALKEYNKDEYGYDKEYDRIIESTIPYGFASNRYDNGVAFYYVDVFDGNGNNISEDVTVTVGTGLLYSRTNPMYESMYSSYGSRKNVIRVNTTSTVTSHITVKYTYPGSSEEITLTKNYTVSNTTYND